MKTYIAAFFLSLTASLILTRIARWAGARLNIVDPAARRKVHKKALPRTGGVAVAVSFFLPVYSLFLWHNPINEALKVRSSCAIALLVGGVLSVILGLWDDIKHIRARYKLLFWK